MSSRSYDENKPQATLSAIRGGMTILRASKAYNVPRTTLRHKFADRAPANITKKRTRMFVRQITGVAIYRMVERMRKNGFSHYQRQDFLLGTKKFQPLKEYLNEARANVSEENIGKWFKETLLLLGEDSEVLKDPFRCWNMDETAFYHASLLKRENPYMELHLIGEFAPSLSLNKFERIPASFINALPCKGWGIDGHSSHLSRFCKEKMIILVCLLPSTTHILQPLDVSVFFPLKNRWIKEVALWRFQHDGKEIRKKNVVLTITMKDLKLNDYVAVAYENDFYPVLEKKTLFYVSTMTKSGSNWKWLSKEDKLLYPAEAIKKSYTCQSRKITDERRQLRSKKKSFESELKNFNKRDALAQLILASSLNDAIVDLTASCGIAKALWDKLFSVDEQSSGQRVDRLMEKILCILTYYDSVLFQCACKWVLRHQHKLKQAARSCSLKVKEAFGAEDRNFEQVETDSEYTFRHKDLTSKLADPNRLRSKPDVKDLKFGKFFTDHMFKVFYHKQLGGWQKPIIIPFENISLHPAAKVLHYAIELFEGLKAYRGVDGKIRIFRPDLNMNRMNKSAYNSGLPTFDGYELIKCLNRLIQVDQEWVPHGEGSSLYIRPTLIGIDGTLGVAQSDSALLYTILCPVGEYFQGTTGTISLLADPRYTRAWPGGCGDQKMGSNYGPTFRVQRIATTKGRQQVLWLYGPDHQITEVGTMNIFMFYVGDDGEKVLATPPLNGLILPGVTRQSIIQLCEQWKEFRVEQRDITMNDVIKLKKKLELLEIFGSGTAAIISPVCSIEYLGELIEVPTTGHPFPLYKKIKDHLAAIQYGHIEHPWAQAIE
ncbi:hypothetical protein NQ314_009310 [Rhamnusium bicolor]|uniref:Branched-chain-amino-acid aminotransferase n=1 Tax=Rhamnusium bicolor TaxID=1586634 RepID=A0AAV8Y362_9CUCU|nr:hypothetical protein NQ314_009310 [Rhamnusium bicolor]